MSDNAYIARHKNGMYFLCVQAGAGTLYYGILIKESIQIVDDEELTPVSRVFKLNDVDKKKT